MGVDVEGVGRGMSSIVVLSGTHPGAGESTEILVQILIHSTTILLYYYTSYYLILGTIIQIFVGGGGLDKNLLG